MRRLFLLLFCLYISSALYSQIDNVGSGRAIKFDGIDDYIDLGNVYDDLTLPFSISAWIYIDPATTQAGPVFVSQDNLPLYNGFWFFATPSGIFIEYGDGRGENLPAYRKGKTVMVPYMKGRWNHVCAVMKGAEDIDLYVNGVNVGGSLSGDSDMPMASNFPEDVAKIGYFLSNGITYRFKGIIDELRIWSYALTDNQIKQTMCKKISGNEPGLIGYWTFDETSGTQLKDKSVNKFDGQLKGNPTRVFSGAPIGDESVFLYTNTWTNKSASLDFNDHHIKVDNVLGNPYGVHQYAVNNIPSQTNGLNLSTVKAPYFGVFIVSADDDNSFDVSYKYKEQEYGCEAFIRYDNSIANWDKGSTPLKNILQRTEFISGLGAQADIDLGADKILCGQASHILKTDITDPEVSFLWSTGQTTSQITVTQTGNYWVNATSVCGTTSDTVNIVIEKFPEKIVLPDDENLCVLIPRELRATFASSDDVTWQDGSKSPTFQVTDFGLYWAVVKNACGQVSDSVRYTKVDFEEDLIPNVITPNGDPFNEHFLINDKIKGLVSLEIYNRWGTLIYASPHYNNDWAGENLSSGTYFYRMLGNCIGEKKGTLSVLK